MGEKNCQAIRQNGATSVNLLWVKWQTRRHFRPVSKTGDLPILWPETRANLGPCVIAIATQPCSKLSYVRRVPSTRRVHSKISGNFNARWIYEAPVADWRTQIQKSILVPSEFWKYTWRTTLQASQRRRGFEHSGDPSTCPERFSALHWRQQPAHSNGRTCGAAATCEAAAASPVEWPLRNSLVSPQFAHPFRFEAAFC